jgi:LPS export ABC transporter protein LptC
VRAKSANVEGGGERVLLSGDVVVTRAPGRDGAPPMQLRTQQLTAIPDFDRYSTDAPIEIEHGDSVVRSVGMDYDNVQRLVKFRSRVRGTIASTTPSKAAR